MKTFPAKPREASDNAMNDDRGARSRAKQIKYKLLQNNYKILQKNYI